MDSRHYQYLLGTLKLGGPGRTQWIAYKEKNGWIDLSSANLARCPLHGYSLSELDLSMAILRETGLGEADLADAILSCADLRNADLRNAILDRARLDAASLQDANLADACLEGARLIKARLNRAMMIGADLTGADLSGADLSGACLKYARLTGARLTGANVADADLTGAILDETAPQYLQNYPLSRRDDRHYREMRNRPLTGGEPRHFSDEDSQGRLVKVDSRRRPPRRGESPSAGGATPRESPGSAGARQAQVPPQAGIPPLRDTEPDLSTFEGCCAVLEVPATASMDQIVKAFRAKAKLYHPDKVRHLSPRLRELAAEEFRRLRQAYEAITRRTARPLVGINWPEGMPRYASPYDYSSAEYEVLARINPANASILYNLAWKYFEEERYAEARAGFMRVLAINPNDQDAQFNLIIVRLYTELLLPELGS